MVKLSNTKIASLLPKILKKLGDANVRLAVQTSRVAKGFIWILGGFGFYVLGGCEMGPTASERYQVEYLNELDGDSKERYCEDFIALAGGSGERACSDGSYFVVQELEECVATELPRCSIDDFEICIDAGIDDPCKLFSDPPYACLDFAECLVNIE